MNALSHRQKAEIMARIKSFSYSGFRAKMTANLRYVGSFVGRDFKIFAQMAVFVLSPFLSDVERNTWLSLSKVIVMYYLYMYPCML